MQHTLRNIRSNMNEFWTEYQGNSSNRFFVRQIPIRCHLLHYFGWANGYSILGKYKWMNEVFLENMSVNTTTGVWSATFYLNVIDHFGLDAPDLSGKNQWRQMIPGFTAWWRLQHRKDYKPFRTLLRVKTSINGDYK